MIEEDFPDRSATAGENQWWRWVGASRQGRSHIAAGTPCQDSFRIAEMSGGILIAAVADGAGSAPRSQEGAIAAVELLSEFLSDHLRPDKTMIDDFESLLRRAFFYVAGVLKIVAKEDQAQLSEFHTTLTCAIATQAYLAIAQVGDGAVAVRGISGTLETVMFPEHGEYANSTYFVTQLPEAKNRLHIRILKKPCTALGLTTDGLIDIAFDAPYGECQPFGPFFDPLFDRVAMAAPGDGLSQRLLSFLDSPLISEATSDDLTLVLAVRQNDSRGGNSMNSSGFQAPVSKAPTRSVTGTAG